LSISRAARAAMNAQTGTVARHKNTTLFSGDVAQLSSGGWITSKVVHFHSSYLLDRYNSRGNIHVFSSHLMDLLTSEDIVFDEGGCFAVMVLDLGVFGFVLFVKIKNIYKKTIKWC
jgi:hypothetical protein